MFFFCEIRCRTLSCLSGFQPLKTFNFHSFAFLSAIHFVMALTSKQDPFSLKMDDTCVLGCDMQLAGDVCGGQSREAHTDPQHHGGCVWDAANSSLSFCCV